LPRTAKVNAEEPPWATILARADERQLNSFSPLEHLPITEEEKQIFLEQYRIANTGNEHLVEFIPRLCRSCLEGWRAKTVEVAIEWEERGHEQFPRSEQEVNADMEYYSKREQNVRRIFDTAMPILMAWHDRWIELGELAQRPRRRPQSKPVRWPRLPSRDPEAAHVDDCEGGYLDIGDHGDYDN
jgi:hypothetical protein